MVKIAPSLLSADFTCLKDEINKIETAQWIHYDVMDGHFVPNISFGHSILNDVSKITDMYLDVHLMISEPAKYIDNFIASKASLIVFHYEAVVKEEVDNLIDYIKNQHVDVGISIKPDTPVEEILPFFIKIRFSAGNVG